MRIFNYFYLSLYHLTDENSLIFAATFLCRLTAPLSYNFLGMIHMDQTITKKTDREQTVFTTVTNNSSFVFRSTKANLLDHGDNESHSDRFQRFQLLFSDVNLSALRRNVFPVRIAMFAHLRHSTVLRRRSDLGRIHRRRKKSDETR